jgi:hypothetical protein
VTATTATPDLFRAVGVAVASAQLFEVVFVIAGKLALKQADIAELERVEPLSASRSFKQPVKALLNELAQAGSVDPKLGEEISRVLEDRHRIIHRAFLECGWPSQMTSEKTAEFVELCAHVNAESQRLAHVFIPLVFAWMSRFTELSPTAKEYEAKFKELAMRVMTGPGGAP